MDAAWITVIGTLGGVVVSSTVGLVTVAIAERHHRRRLAMETRLADRTTLRAERREAFIAYLAAYREMYGKAHALGERGGVQPQAVGVRGPAGVFEREAPDEVLEFSQAYFKISITAGARVRKCVDTCTASIWNLAEACVVGEADAIREADHETQNARRVLREAMRHELGVDETTS